jgi:methylated-DNA-[protein]-cysteine S-methyltransferase
MPISLCRLHEESRSGCYDPFMDVQGYTLFDTAIGRCGMAWSADGVTRVQLPQSREHDTRAHLRQRSPGAVELPPPPTVQEAIGAVMALLRGERRLLDAIPLDMENVPEFHRRVY